MSSPSPLPEWQPIMSSLFSSKGRLRVVLALAAAHPQPLYFGEIVDAAGVPAGSLIRDLRTLRQDGVLVTDPPGEPQRGRAVRYILNVEYLRGLLQDAQRDILPQ